MASPLSSVLEKECLQFLNLKFFPLCNICVLPFFISQVVVFSCAIGRCILFFVVVVSFALINQLGFDSNYFAILCYTLDVCVQTLSDFGLVAVMIDCVYDFRCGQQSRIFLFHKVSIYCAGISIRVPNHSSDRFNIWDLSHSLEYGTGFIRFFNYSFFD